jgi:hypothetical protein
VVRNPGIRRLPSNRRDHRIELQSICTDPTRRNFRSNALLNRRRTPIGASGVASAKTEQASVHDSTGLLAVTRRYVRRHQAVQAIGQASCCMLHVACWHAGRRATLAKIRHWCPECASNRGLK